MERIALVLGEAAFWTHLAFIIVALPSALLFALGAYRRAAPLAAAHVTAVAFMAAWQAKFLECPLVTLERTMREAAGDSMAYSGSFTVYVLSHVLWFEVPVEAVTGFSLLVSLLTLASMAALTGEWARGRSRAAA